VNETMEGYYVSGEGKILEVRVERTSNPDIVKVLDSVIGMLVLDRQFFEDATDARDQAMVNAQETIDTCNEILDDLEKPKRGTKKTATVPQGNSKSGWGRKAADPLGPPKYGVGKYLTHKKSRAEYKIIGFRNEADDGIIYILSKTGGTGTLRYDRDQIDAQFEVVE
jgi:hypothetical protein